MKKTETIVHSKLLGMKPWRFTLIELPVVIAMIAI